MLWRPMLQIRPHLKPDWCGLWKGQINPITRLMGIKKIGINKKRYQQNKKNTDFSIWYKAACFSSLGHPPWGPRDPGINIKEFWKQYFLRFLMWDHCFIIDAILTLNIIRCWDLSRSIELDLLYNLTWYGVYRSYIRPCRDQTRCLLNPPPCACTTAWLGLTGCLSTTCL